METIESQLPTIVVPLATMEMKTFSASRLETGLVVAAGLVDVADFLR